MSYTINEAKNERALDIECATIARNPQELQRLALLAKEEGDDEQAEALMHMFDHVMESVKEMQDEMKRDDEEHYKQERESERYESHRDELFN